MAKEDEPKFEFDEARQPAPPRTKRAEAFIVGRAAGNTLIQSARHILFQEGKGLAVEIGPL
jgi:hypothetical protein